MSGDWLPGTHGAAFTASWVAWVLGLVFVLTVLASYFVFFMPRLTRAGKIATAIFTVVGAGAWAHQWPWASFQAVAVLLAFAFGHLGHWSSERRRSRSQWGESPTDSAAVAPAALAALAQPHSTPDGALPEGEPPRVGKNLGRYRIERQIGQGAMGEVYLATDPKIGRAVAIKTLALSRDFEGQHLVHARERFFREAEMAGRLKHPDIVTIFDANEDQGLAYIAMEFLTGHDLLPFTQARTLLPVHEVLALTARVARALAHAHGMGVVHRDVKPANVMVDLRAQVVKVTDFGIAQVCDAVRTRTGIVMGSPLYMSPEQLSGERLDGRSDLYSLGVVLYQLLTGRLPHESSSMGVLLRQIAQDAAPDVRSIRPELPHNLADVVALALQKRAAYRYADGMQMAADLDAVARQIRHVGATRASQVAAFTAQLPERRLDTAATVRLP